MTAPDRPLVPLPSTGRTVFYGVLVSDLERGVFYTVAVPAIVAAVHVAPGKGPVAASRVKVDLVVLTSMPGLGPANYRHDVAFKENAEGCWWWPPREERTMMIDDG